VNEPENPQTQLVLIAHEVLEMFTAQKRYFENRSNRDLLITSKTKESALIKKCRAILNTQEQLF
jgi:hypothetical protein